MDNSKKLLILASIVFTLVSTQAIAKGMPVTNLTQCTCIDTVDQPISCKKGTHPMSIEFGTTTAKDPNNTFTQTKPPTIVAPGATGVAPLTPISQSLYLVWRIAGTSLPTSNIVTAEFGGASALTFVAVKLGPPMPEFYPLPLSSAWINNNCDYIGPQ